MATASQSQKPSPERIFGVLNAFQSSAALKTAIELDVFTVIADGAHRADSIAQQVNAAERGVRILCDYLTIHEFLTRATAVMLSPQSLRFFSTGIRLLIWGYWPIFL